MKKYLAASAALCLTGGLLGAMSPASAASDDPASLKAEGASYLRSHPAVVKGSAGDHYAPTAATVGKSGTVHQRYDRTYEGLRVLGGDFVVHTTKAGKFSVSVGLDKAISLSTAPAVSAGKAASISKGVDPVLVVDARQGTPTLVWLTTVNGVQVDGTPSRKATMVDAKSGKVTDSVEQITTMMSAKDAAKAQNVAKGKPGGGTGSPAVGTGAGIFVGNVPIATTALSTGGFTMVDTTHGGNSTCDLNNGKAKCAVFTDTDNAWGNGSVTDRASAAVDAHLGAALTWDFFQSSYARNGIFDDGVGVPSRVHYGRNYVNAFWDGKQMTYGDGANNVNPLVALDVAGHEMSHGVTEATAGLGYSGDAGGLNEATSDVMGTMVEFSANNANDPGDFLIGEEINIRGNGTPLRWMDKPSRDGVSFDCWSSAVPASDPHYSSGVGNHAFYLLANGSGSSTFGDSPTCDGSTVTGLGRDKAAAIWYYALRDYMNSNETYAQARTDMIAAATEHYGAAEAATVAAVFSAVGVN